MHEWSKPQVFNRVSNIYNFSKNPLSQKNILKHIFMPWSESQVVDLMFQFKAEIKDNGKCFIPFMDEELKPMDLHNKDIIPLLEQVGNGVETHLIMSNLDSIHIFKVENILKAKDLVNKDNVISNFEGRDDFKYWIEVSDLYVFRANHLAGEKNHNQHVINDLNELLSDQLRQNFFSPVQKLNITSDDCTEKSGAALNWIGLNRNLTYDYFIRSCELEENIYQESWGSLTRQTRHCLISSEQTRHQAIQYQDGEKFVLLKEAYEHYISALLSEVNEIYITPLMENFYRFECLLTEWQEVDEGLVNKDLKRIIDHLIDNKSRQLDSLESFLFYIRNIKTGLYTLKSKFSKKISKEEHLQIESFLNRQENLAESFLCQKLDQKLDKVLDIKNWIQNLNDSYQTLSSHELSDLTLKLTHLLSIMSATSYEDNIFFKLIEEKTSKGIVRRSFEDEVKQLTQSDRPGQVKLAA